MEFQAHTRRPVIKRNRRLGAATIEFALVVPVFLLFVFGMIEFSRMVSVKQSLTKAAREGCRHAALATTTNPIDVEAKVRSCLRSVVPNDQQVRITVPNTLANACSGLELTVAVEVNFSDATWVSARLLDFNPVIRAQATQKRE